MGIPHLWNAPWNFVHKDLTQVSKCSAAAVQCGPHHEWPPSSINFWAVKTAASVQVSHCGGNSSQVMMRSMLGSLSQASLCVEINIHFSSFSGFLTGEKPLGSWPRPQKMVSTVFCWGFPLKWGSPKTLVGEWKILLKWFEMDDLWWFRGTLILGNLQMTRNDNPDL